MVKVHIWLRHGQNVGHAGLTIGTRYVSFWPATPAGGIKDIKIKRSQPGEFVSELQTDILNEGGRHPITIEVKGLDEKQILQYISHLQRSDPRYQLVRHNCSHVVARALMAGSQKKPGFTPHAGDYVAIGKLARGVWTPPQVLRFARELTKVHV